MQRLGYTLMGVTVAALLAACVQVYPPESGVKPAQNGQGTESAAQTAKKDEDKEKSPFKPYDEVLKDTKKVDGFFTFHLHRDNKLFLELRPEQLDQDFGLMMHYSRGVGDFNLHDGLPALGNTQLMRFTRVGDKILLVHRNSRFTAEAGTPMAVSLEDNVGHSIVSAFEIKSVNEETKNLVVEVTDFFVSDYSDEANSLKFWYGNKPVRFEKKLSYIDSVKGFPENVEIDAMLTFEANDFPRFGGPGVSDWRSIPLGMRFSLFALPEEPMQPRYADDRVGHFLTAVKDFSRDQKDDAFVRFVERWRLEKKDPGAELSEPVEPIVYYIDRSVPMEYRKYVRAGIEAWNEAFEAAGFKNAVVAKDAPTPEEDPDWSAEDIRYSTVRWTAAHSMGYAIGPSQTDPRSGEILNADVLISSTFVRGWLYDWEELGDANAMLERFNQAERVRQTLRPELATRFCMAEMGKSHQLGVEYAMLLGLGTLPAGSPMPEDYLGDAIIDLVLHEVGHTLGLRHNFKGSSGIPNDKLNDVSYTKDHGVSLSVMDYNPVNIATDPAAQGMYWSVTPGPYDVWAIRYAYTPVYAHEVTAGTDGSNGSVAAALASPDEELSVIDEIAAEVAEPDHAYNTDEDNWLGPWAVDPLTSAWELGSDPVAYAQDRAAIVARVNPKLEGKLIASGEGYQRLRAATSRLIFERYISMLPVTKMVGGLYFHRDHKGDPNGRDPFMPVPAAKQREAVQLIVDQAFDEDAFEFDAKTLNKMAPNRFLHWGTGSSTPVDFAAHDFVASLQTSLLVQLLNPIRVGRMIDNELRTPGEAYTAAELYNDLTRAIWSELGAERARSIDSFRRNLQRAHVDQLIAVMLDQGPEVPEDARSLSRLHLKRIDGRVEGALEREALDDFTRAHLEETHARIQRALDAQFSIEVK